MVAIATWAVYSKMEDIISALEKFPYFGPWDETVVKECCEVAKIKRVPPDTILIGEVGGEAEVEEMAHFILEGSCNVILCAMKPTAKSDIKIKISKANSTDEKLQHHLTLSTRITSFTMLKPPSLLNSSLTVDQRKIDSSQQRLKQNSKKAVFKFLQCAQIRTGGCFGLGEDLMDRYIISSTAMVCLLVPRPFLLQHNPYNIWNRIKQFLTLYLPSNSKVLEELRTNTKWLEYRKKEVLWIIRNKNFDTKVTSADSPYSLRIMQL